MLHAPTRIGAGDRTSVRQTARQACHHVQQRSAGSACTSSRRIATHCALEGRQLMVKLSVAEGTGRLDLSECELPAVPPGLCNVTRLQDLSLAGNRIEQLPEAVGQLKDLRRLVLAGNRLQALPEELGQLEDLEGLWAHGNLLGSLPGSIGGATALEQLSLAGNCLQELPPSLSSLTSLQDLNLAGNRLASLPSTLSCLSSLTKLSLHGNQLTQLPCDWAPLSKLKGLFLQGNCLETLPEGLGQLQAVEELSLADNALASLLPGSFSYMTSLQKLYLYGNALTELPVDALASLPSLRALWLEGNPLSRATVEALLQAAPTMTALKQLGLDESQLRGVDPALVAAAGPALRVGVVEGSGKGYFKLQRRPAAVAEAADGGAGSSNGAGGSGGDAAGSNGAGANGASSSDSSGSSDSSISRSGIGSISSAGSWDAAKVLVVAFGSAPGTPNWGGLLKQVYSMATEDAHRSFDILYVVDPCRQWYCGGEPQALQQHYTSRLQQYTQHYKHVVFLGDSMGATAALLMAPLATTVLAFCPQVDLRSASIRPGQPDEWLEALQKEVLAAVGRSKAPIRCFSGTWQHDLDQVILLQNALPTTTLKVYGVESHRLALALTKAGKLAPLVREAVLQEMGLQSGNIRVANLL